MQPSLYFIFCGSVLSTLFVVSGALLTINPKLFARIHRRITHADYWGRGDEWEKQMVGLEGRLGGFIFFCTGVGGFYLLLRSMKIL